MSVRFGFGSQNFEEKLILVRQKRKICPPRSFRLFKFEKTARISDVLLLQVEKKPTVKSTTLNMFFGWFPMYPPVN